MSEIKLREGVRVRKEIKLRRPDRAEGGAELNPALMGVLDGFSALM